MFALAIWLSWWIGDFFDNSRVLSKRYECSNSNGNDNDACAINATVIDWTFVHVFRYMFMFRAVCVCVCLYLSLLQDSHMSLMHNYLISDGSFCSAVGALIAETRDHGGLSFLLHVCIAYSYACSECYCCSNMLLACVVGVARRFESFYSLDVVRLSLFLEALFALTCISALLRWHSARQPQSAEWAPVRDFQFRSSRRGRPLTVPFALGRPPGSASYAASDRTKPNKSASDCAWDAKFQELQRERESSQRKLDQLLAKRHLSLGIQLRQVQDCPVRPSTEPAEYNSRATAAAPKPTAEAEAPPS